MRTLLLLIILFASCPGFAQDLSLYLKKEFISPEGGRLPYRILFPQNYDQTKKYPLILVLHGSGERGSDNQKQLVHGSQLFLDPGNREKFPAFVVFPQCPQESYWSSVRIDRNKSALRLDFDYDTPANEPMTLTMMLIEELASKESIDTRRIYVTGLSMGGMGTFEVVHRYPKTFAAALPICGGGDTLRYRRVKTPFWVFHGSADPVVDVNYSRAMVEKLKEKKIKVKYTEYAGVNHNSWDSAFAEPDYLKWMFAQKRRKKGL